MGDARVPWHRCVAGLAPDAAPRPLVLDSWRRSRAAGVDPEPAQLAPRRVPDEELERRCAANAELLAQARHHLGWLSAAHASVPHVAYLVDVDGIVLFSTGTDPRVIRTLGCPGHDWSEGTAGTNGAGTALVAGEPVAVAGPEHFARPLRDYVCAGAPVRGPAGEIVGAIALGTLTATAAPEGAPAEARVPDEHLPEHLPERLLVVAHAAYAIGLELRAADALRRASGHLEAERRLAEALRESEARYERNAANVPGLVYQFIYRPDGSKGFTFASEGARTLFGVAPEAMLRDPAALFDLVHPEDRPGMHASGAAAVAALVPWRWEGRAVLPTGEERWVQVASRNARQPDGGTICDGLLMDVTERRQAVARLAESEQRYRQLVELSPDGIAVHAEGRFRFVNPALARVLGYDAPEELVGEPVVERVHPVGRTGVRARIEDILAGAPGLPEDHRLVRRDGTLVDVETVGVSTTFEGAPAIQTVLRDVTERKRAEAALRESEERYRLVQRATKDVIWDLDLTTGTVVRSAAVETAFRYLASEHDEELTWWIDRVHAEDRERTVAAMRAVIDGGGSSWTGEYRFQRGDGAYAAVLDRGYVLRDAGGRAVRMIGAMQDLTERQQLEAQLRQAQKMEVVGQLAGGIAHDFNNLLAAITGYAELLHADLTWGDPRRADVEEILEGARRGSGLTRQLLAFSRKQVLQPEALDLNEVVMQATAMLRPLLGSALHLIALAAPTPVPVVADRTQLEQVLMNLAINARDAMPDGGTLTIEVGGGSVGPAEPGAPDGAPPAATLVVRDTGVGMPPDVQARLFEPFFTTKPVGQGTGLGLATVLGIVQQSGGTIRVASRPGAGTTFTVTLPLAEPALEPAPKPAPEPAAAAARTVLLVDDEDAMRTVARRVLERAGYRVLVARHGADALRLLEEHGPAVDVLLSDVVMPEMGGVELAARAVERLPGLPVVLMSGYAGVDVGPIGRDGGVQGFVQKPFTAEALLAAVRGAASAT